MKDIEEKKREWIWYRGYEKPSPRMSPSAFVPGKPTCLKHNALNDEHYPLMISSSTRKNWNVNFLAVLGSGKNLVDTPPSIVEIRCAG